MVQVTGAIAPVVALASNDTSSPRWKGPPTMLNLATGPSLSETLT